MVKTPQTVSLSGNVINLNKIKLALLLPKLLFYKPSVGSAFG